MSRLFVVLGFVLLITPCASAAEMDLMLKSLTGGGAMASVAKSLPGEGGEKLVPCLVRTKDVGATSGKIEGVGGSSARISDTILSANIPLSAVAEVSSAEEIVSMEFAAPLSSKLDTARAQGEVIPLQDGSALGTAYNGKHVVVGIVDDGLDYGHPDFGGTSTRIQYVRQVGSDGTAIECTKRTINNETCAIENGGQGYTHGTHVTGIAAGADPTYTGVAPQADIMFVFINALDASTNGDSPTSFATNILESAAKIFEKADVIDKPAVVNMSLGTSLGAHDGTSLLEQGLSDLVAGKRGRILVGAAGNEQVVPAQQSESRRAYVGGIHASVDVAEVTSEASRFGVWSGSGSASAYTGGTVVDLWLSPGQKDSCSVALMGYTNGRSASDFTFPGLTSTDNATFSTTDVPFSADSSSSFTSDDGNVTAEFQVDDSDIRNGKPHAMIFVKPATGKPSSSLESFWFDIVVRATAGGTCSGHMWLYYDYTPYHDFLKGLPEAAYTIADGARGAGYSLRDGDSLYTMTIPATSTGVIAAGSWIDQKPLASGLSQWVGMNGNTYDQNSVNSPGGSGSIIDDLSDFSSLGPTADERPKPEIIAPGEPIISSKARDVSVSTSIKVNDYHFKNAGTSMAAPFVTGVVALLLERNNTLTVDDVRSIIGSGASTSGLNTKTPDPVNSYGQGKINAASILGAVSTDTSAYRGTGDLDSPDGASSGCSVLRDGVISYRASLLVLALVLAVPSLASRLLAARRRR